MKRIAVLLVAALALSGCAALQTLEGLYNDVSGTSIPPDKVYILAESFDAAKIGASKYFTYCRTHLTTSPCSADNRRIVLKAIRAGTPARDQLEVYLKAGTSAPVQIYNTLLAAVGALKSSVIAQGAVQ